MVQQFNTDLLAEDGDRATARKAFPRIFFALDNPALRQIFSGHDGRANVSKTRSRTWGVFAVFLATLALLLAASSDLYENSGETAIRAIAVVGALSGIGSVVIAVMGVMYRKRKIRWLTDRLATERLRQFHFQQYIAHAAEIVAGGADPARAASYLERREIGLEKLKADFLSRLDAEFQALIEADDFGDGFFFPGKPPPPAGEASLLEEYFSAYETLRFRRQIDYCNLLLSEKRSLFANAPARQAKFFAALAMLLVLSILLFDAVVFVGAIADQAWFKQPLVQAAGLWAAFLALAVRTLEEGFQVEGETARMRHYRQAINRIYLRFKNATEPEGKIEAMVELEKTAYDEMVTFLKSHHEAEFVM
ncbi:MAG: hypothetical protein HXY23_09420 [Parvularculaceae bacterium]|jgi:hypothetical protein|nr:hypothetical protein [Parvularculaceae bacterium]